MTKGDLIEEVARSYPRFSQRDAEVVVNTVFEGMTLALTKGERIEPRGFGTFSIKHRPARERRNPKTGEVVSLAAEKVPFFKVAKEMRLRVDGRVPAVLRRSGRPASGSGSMGDARWLTSFHPSTLMSGHFFQASEFPRLFADFAQGKNAFPLSFSRYW